MNRDEALKIVLAAADLFARMLEDKQTAEAADLLRPLTHDSGVVLRPILRYLEWTDQSVDVPGMGMGNWLLASAQVHNTMLHVQALRVKRTKDGLQIANNKNMQPELDALAGLYDQAFTTTTIPGYKGDFVIYAHPYGE